MRLISMEIEFDIKITFGNLYDYLLHCTYLSMQGLIGTAAGAFFLVEFFLSLRPVFLVVALLVLLYLPVDLFLKAKQQSLNPVFQQPLHYKLTQEGVTVSQGETQETQKWADMYKAGSTVGSVLLYTAKRRASVFPKKQIEEQGVKEKVIEMISTHMPPKKVNVR